MAVLGTETTIFICNNNIRMEIECKMLALGRLKPIELATEGERKGTCFPGKSSAWIDDVGRWTGNDMNVARTNAMKRRYDCC